LPWGHNVRLLDAVKAAPERTWYARQAIENGWSRNVLVHQIESGLFARQGGALTNFTRTLPAGQSELAQQVLKDPYSFDFLSLGPEMLERDLERGLIEHPRSLILELGKGFAFVRQPISYRSRRSGLLPRSSLLSPTAALLRRDRTQCLSANLLTL
jgi:predicted nuclease of restriction endonuclease-like (RecB) superfamily